VQSNYLMVATAAALMLQGCSSRPREFEPTLAVASADTAAFDQAYATCTDLMIAGKLDSSGRLASAGAGAVAGATVAVAGGAAAASAGMYAGAAVASATVVLIPFVALGSAFGLAKMKRAKKEKAIKTAMTGCLKERGYAVNGWERVKKARPNSLPGASTAARR
jgi:hypothetical protein